MTIVAELYLAEADKADVFHAEIIEMEAGHHDSLRYGRRGSMLAESFPDLFNSLEDERVEGIIRDPNYLTHEVRATAFCMVTSVKSDKRSIGIATKDIHGGKVELGHVSIPPTFRLPQVGVIVEVEVMFAYNGGHVFQDVYAGAREDVSQDQCLLSSYRDAQIAAFRNMVAKYHRASRRHRMLSESVN